MKRYIITGAPSTGKTTLINALQNKGYFVFEEVSRRVIKSEQAQGGDKTPWQDVTGFTDLVYQKTLEELNTPIQQWAFVDRGLADNIAYLEVKNHPIARKFLNFNYSDYYYNTVFILPIWEDIYIQDEQRLQSFEEAKHIQQLLLKTYKELGFSTVLMPQNSIEERVEIIEATIV